MAKINNAISSALVKQGISEEDAKKVVIAIAKGLIPNTSIRY